MAKLPSIEESLRVQQGSPTAIAGTTDARLQGEAIQGLGTSFVNLAKALDEKRKTKDRLALLEIQNMADEQKINSRNFALKNPSSNPNGDDIMPDFLRDYEEKTAALLDRIDPKLQRDARAIFKKVSIEGRELLIGESVNRFNTHTGVLAEEAKDSMTSSIVGSPDEAFKHYNTFTKTINALPWTADMKAKVIEAAQNEVPTAIVDSHLGSNSPDRFKKARAVLKEEISNVLSIKQREAESNKINQAEDSHLRNEQQKEDRQRAENERILKETQSTNMAKTLVAISTETDADKRVQLLKDADALFLAKGLSADGWNAAKATNATVPDAENNLTHSKYLDKIYADKNLKGIEDEIVSDMAAGRLRPSTGASLLSSVKAARKTRSSLDPITNKILNQKLKSLEDIYYGKNVTRNFFGMVTSVPPGIAEQKRVAGEKLMKAAEGGREQLERTYQGLISPFLGGRALEKAPAGVSPLVVRDSQSTKEYMKEQVKRMGLEEAKGRKGSKDYMEAKKKFDSLVPILKRQTEQDQLEQELNPPRDAGLNSRRRRGK